MIRTKREGRATAGGHTSLKCAKQGTRGHCIAAHEEHRHRPCAGPPPGALRPRVRRSMRRPKRSRCSGSRRWRRCFLMQAQHDSCCQRRRTRRRSHGRQSVKQSHPPKQTLSRPDFWATTLTASAATSFAIEGWPRIAYAGSSPASSFGTRRIGCPSRHGSSVRQMHHPPQARRSPVSPSSATARRPCGRSDSRPAAPPFSLTQCSETRRRARDVRALVRRDLAIGPRQRRRTPNTARSLGATGCSRGAFGPLLRRSLQPLQGPGRRAGRRAHRPQRHRHPQHARLEEALQIPARWRGRRHRQARTPGRMHPGSPPTASPKAKTCKTATGSSTTTSTGTRCASSSASAASTASARPTPRSSSSISGPTSRSTSTSASNSVSAGAWCCSTSRPPAKRT
jgi:hypothetical protein